MKKTESVDEIEDTKIVDSLNAMNVTEYIDTTLLIHLFGHEGQNALFYKDFTK